MHHAMALHYQILCGEDQTLGDKKRRKAHINNASLGPQTISTQTTYSTGGFHCMSLMHRSREAWDKPWSGTLNQRSYFILVTNLLIKDMWPWYSNFRLGMSLCNTTMYLMANIQLLATSTSERFQANVKTCSQKIQSSQKDQVLNLAHHWHLI